MAKTNRHYSRRDAMRWLVLTSAGAALAGCGGEPASEPPAAATTRAPAVEPTPAELQETISNTPQPAGVEEKASPVDPVTEPTAGQPATGQAYLAVARGEDPAAITAAALRALGGIERFVKNGYDVIIKPNICTDYYTYEFAATTNPQVVAALVTLALGAGAKRVRVMDFPFGGTPASAYARSGIEDAVKEAGGEMEIMNSNKFRKTKIPQGLSITEWEIYQDVLNCDLMINVPIAKHHSLSRITVGGKNLLGVIQRRSMIHSDLGQRIADLVSIIRPGLTVVDGVRTLMNHGPTGGNLDDVQQNNTIIASHDLVAADAYAAGFFGLSGEDVSYIQKSAEMGLGSMDLSTLKVEEISL